MFVYFEVNSDPFCNGADIFSKCSHRRESCFILIIKVSTPPPFFFFFNRALLSSAYTAGRPPSQHNCLCWRRCRICVQGIQWCPAPYSLGEICRKEWKPIWSGWDPIHEGFKGKNLLQNIHCFVGKLLSILLVGISEMSWQFQPM